MAKGWHRESRRHSLASRGIKTATDKAGAVSKINLNRYSGKWFEHSRFPKSFQEGCLQSTANYKKKRGGEIEVVNTCKREDGGVDKVTGSAVVQSPDTLGVRFFFLAPRSPYKIEFVDKDYNYAIVGHPKKENLWILSRNESITDDKLSQLKSIAKSKGYAISKLKDVS